MSVELTIETVEETIVLELQDHVPAVLTIDHIPELRDELDSKVGKEDGKSLVSDAEIEKLLTVEQYAQKNTVNSVAGKQGDVLLDKSDVGLSEVDNTTDADKPVSTAVADALADKVDAVAGMGLSELSFTTADKSSLDQSEQDRHTHNNKPVIDDLSDDSGVLQYKGLPISDQAALDAKVDKVAGKSLVDDSEIAKLVTVQENATANRDDALNADKVHEHVIADIDDLTAKLELINQWLQVPAGKKYFDFMGNRYSADGVPATVSSLSQFTRLSSATMWKAGKVIDVPENTPRINTDGLLIEPQRTNLFPDSVITTGSGVIPTTLEIGEGNIVPAVRLPHGIITYAYAGITCPNPCTISMYVKNSDNSEPAFSGRYTGAEYDFVFVFAGGGPLAPYTVSKINSVYRVSLTSTGPASSGNTGIVKRATNSPKDVTATWRQLEAGDTLTSYIRSSGSPATRAKETLVVPFTAGQTVTADKDAGVTMTIVDNNAVFEGQGYIRSIEVN